MNDPERRDAFGTVTVRRDFVLLRRGLTVPRAALRLLLDLEDRGLTLEADRGTLVVSPSRLLTEEDRARIRWWKPHLLALVTYYDEKVIAA